LESMKEAFEWRFEFPEVLNKNGDSVGFDLIVANPPYIRIQGLDKDKSEYYKKIFKSAVGNYDIYVLFVEKFLPFLKDGGNMNFIMPHKWINSSFGKGLRTIVNHNISQFISFGEYLIFDNAMTYTSLLMLHKEKQENLKYIEFVEIPKTKEERQEIPKEEKHDEVSQFLQNLKDDDFINLKTEKLGSEPWIFKKPKIMEILAKLEKQPLRVSDVFERIFQGIATSGDDIYLLECSEIVENENCLECFSKELEKYSEDKYQKFEEEVLFAKDEDGNYKHQWFIDIFGSQEQEGEIIFFDSFSKDVKIQKDIMTPHYGDYYDKKKKVAPTDTQSPNPIPFLTVVGEFRFFIASKKESIEKYKIGDKSIKEWLKEALTNHGIGAKTAVGYGYFE